MSEIRNCECENNRETRETRESLTKKIMELKFAIIDISLYLNAHPNDNRALCLHNEYTKKFKELTDKYQRVYGPLTIEFPCNKWRWLEMPWPWEKGAY